MKTPLKQNFRLALAGIALLFVATVASVKAEYRADMPTNTAKAIAVKSSNFGWPGCDPMEPGCR